MSILPTVLATAAESAAVSSSQEAQEHILTNLAILVLAGFVGYAVISKVPNTLHTPLMSGTNAIHGIVILGGLLIIGLATGFVNDLLLVIAIAFGTINVVGGFLVTDRMLEMFKSKPGKARADTEASTE
ncbi:NAD(P) transhydrogenase subunit alpha [soil metagenome]|jgi:NAD(P) transhydrogenase subunit alpha